MTKRADASTLAVVNAVKSEPAQHASRAARRTSTSASSSTSRRYVTRAMWGVLMEGAWAALLTGLMVLLFLHDWRSVVVVVLNIPFALLGSVVGPVATGQTVNIMTLGGLALAVGILVDEATVEVENIHTQFEHTPNIAPAVRLGNAQTAVPRLLAMLCVLAVFLPSFFMEGAARALFVPLSLAVGFAMVASYFLSSTFVPVTVGLAAAARPSEPTAEVAGRFSFTRFQALYERRPARNHAFPRLAGARVCGGGRPADLARWQAARHRHLSACRFRAVPAPLACRRRHASGNNGGDRHAGPGGHQGRGRTGPGGDLRGLCRPDPDQLPHQHSLSVDPRPRGGGPPRRLDQRQPRPRRGAETPLAPAAAR